MSKHISSPFYKLPVESKVGFFIGQAILLLSLPVEMIAAFMKLPSWVEAQASESMEIDSHEE